MNWGYPHFRNFHITLVGPQKQPKTTHLGALYLFFGKRSSLSAIFSSRIASDPQATDFTRQKRRWALLKSPYLYHTGWAHKIAKLVYKWLNYGL